ncbi:pseudouridylate synthase (nucleomorph) [Chroomonas mesostigmatica CCMP1168]|uniref:Pseudouridylate synthase n=1 Tax=Chroomonas mesostigmatica CCMP1168 TaxID=1195612 RepID=J7G6M3_9CRYP|nr:pseudouridylate synthase [Chroomonas mesostigmatica CCMP1168]
MKSKIEEKTNKWPLFLKSFCFLGVKADFLSADSNNNILKSPTTQKTLYEGIVNIDKPSGWNSHEISLWIKKSLGIEKTKNLEKADSNFTGCLLICLGNIFFFENINIESKKDYICVFNIKNSNIFKSVNFRKITNILNGNTFHAESFFSNLKSHLKIRNKFSSNLSEIDSKKFLGILEISSNFTLSSPFFFFNFGFILGKNVNLLEIRKIRFGNITEDENLFNLQDLIDAKWISRCLKNNFFLKKIFSPVEFLLSFHKRIIVKNSAINSLCYGSKLSISGILRFEKNIENEENLILLSTKGEMIALGKSKLNTNSIFKLDVGLCVFVTSIIMEKDYYPKRWGFGIVATKKNLLISSGIQIYFKKKKITPKKWWKK